jgi:glycosyltransferase involved in cell wall biosynthesis
MAPRDGLETRSSDEPHPETEERPFVSVVVPVYEDPVGITTTLGALTTQTYPDDRHEVVVVDNGSSDNTPDMVGEIARVRDPVRLVVEPNGGSYAARNAGIESARGSVLSFVDADMWVGPDWLERVVGRLAETDAAYLACDVELPAPSGRQSLVERYNRRTAFPVREYVEEWAFAPTCCLTVRREVVEDIGAFDDRLVSSGDREFGNRVADAGYDPVFAEDVTMTHPPRTTLSSLVGKAVRIGVGSCQVRRYHPERYGRPLHKLANPLTYTPPLPRSMASHVRGWDGVPLSRKLSFALLSWVLTLAKAVGAWREALGDRDRGGVTTTSEVGTE